MSKTKLLKDTVVALGGTVDENDKSSNDLLKKIVVTLGGTPDESASSEDLMAQANVLLPDAMGGSGGNAVSPLTVFSYNNPNYPNCYYGQVIYKDTKIKINLVKYLNWLDTYISNFNDEGYDIPDVYYNLDSIFNDTNSGGSGSGSGSGAQSGWGTFFTMYIFDACTKIVNYPSRDGESLNYSMSITFNSDGTTVLKTYGANGYLLEGEVTTPFIPNDGESLREFLIRIGTIECMLEDFAVNKNMLSLSMMSEFAGMSDFDLNQYPVDWLEFINE